MPKRTLAELAANALAHGIDPETPAIAVASVTRPDEQVVSATIATIAAKLADAAPSGPVIVMIGHALGAAQCTTCSAESGEALQVSERPIVKHNLAS
jgi:uroporphyrin-III C-methyltransferase / precorrin-2 dehydrogenase / sirohydrochlorin ferrochelatase